MSGCDFDRGGQLGLELWPRDHDLPPRWDGMPVQWGDWGDGGRVFMCPPPKPQPRACCGSIRPRLFNLGRIWTDPAAAPAAIGLARMRAGRHLVGIISAHRCPDCGQDSVLDPAGQEWDLDETDYTDDGSWDVTETR